jgi:hypothetical protein
MPYKVKIYKGKIRPISEEIVQSLAREGDIEVAPEEMEEVILDVEAIIKEYIRLDEDLNRQAREILQQRGLSYTEFGKVKRELAEEKRFEVGDRAMFWIGTQILECFMVNNRVSEIYSEDWVMRKKMVKIFNQHLGLEEQIDKEARSRIKNIQEGTPEWEIEYKKLYNQIARKRGLL